MEEIREIEEREFTFKESDRRLYGVLAPDGNDLMAEISGFDLNVAFNMRVINSLADAEACADALADVFYEALMEQLIELKPSVTKPVEAENSIIDTKE